MLSPTALAEVARLARERAGSVVTMGRLLRVTGQLIEAHLPGAEIGDLVEIERDAAAVTGEVVGLREELALVVPLGDVRRLAAGARVRRLGTGADIPVSDEMVGRLVDVFGAPMDGGPPIHAEARVPIDRPPLRIDHRAAIAQRLETGVRVLDGVLPFGRGQRVGIFAGAGVGKTVLMRQLIAQCGADVVVVGLIGERGCEVFDLLGSEARKRSVVLAATSDRSPLERARGARAATAIAEHFAHRGAHVLLVIDSLTRYAMAMREIGLAAGELPATKGYPPSVFASLPRLLERVAPLGRGGSITGVYTVLVEGDDLADPVADSARSLLDGHVVLSRDLAARGHFPAVDVLASASRVARQVTTRDEQRLMERARGLLAVRHDVEELKSLGAYVPGASPEQDRALTVGKTLDGWLRQRVDERATAAATIDALRAILDQGGVP